MASLIPQTNFQNTAPDWTGSSKKPDPNSARPNKTFQSLFSGIGEMVTGATKVADQSNMIRIDADVKAGVDSIRGAQAVDDVTAGAAVPSIINGTANTNPGVMGANRELPPEINAAKERMARMKAASDNGTLGNSHYYSQLEALTRQIRSKYPGYRDQIDEIMKSQTGVAPANALRNTVLAQLESLKSKEQKERADTVKFIKENLEFMDAATRARYATTGELPSEQAVRSAKAEVESQKLQTAAAIQKIELAKTTQTNLVQPEAIKLATSQVAQLHGRVFTNLGSIGGGFSKIQESIIKNIASGQTISPQDQQKYLEALTAIEGQYQIELGNIFDKPKTGSNTSLAQDINDPSKVKTIKEEAMKTIASLRESLTNKQYGYFTGLARTLEGMKNDEVSRVYASSQHIRNLNALGAVVPKEVISQILTQPKGSSNWQRTLSAINDTFTVKAASGAPDASFSRQAREAKEAGATPQQINAMLDKRIVDIASPQLDSKTRANLVASVYGDPSTWSKIGRSSQRVMFERMTSPKVTEAILKAYKENPTEMKGSYETYRKWTMNAFFQVNRELGQNLVGVNENAKYIEIKYNPATMSFDATPTSAGVRLIQSRQAMNSPATPEQVLRMNDSFSGTMQAVDQFNASIKQVVPLWKEGGYDPSQEILNTIQKLGIDPNKKSGPGLMEKLWEGIKGALPDKKTEADRTNITIGGENINFMKAFAGNTAGGSPTAQGTVGKIIDVATGKENPPHFREVRPDVRKAFTEIAGAVGFPLKITPHGGVRNNPSLTGSQHSRTNRTAMDIDIRGMTDAQKTKLVAEAVRRGAGGIGSYSGLPSETTMHIDFRPRDSNAPPVVWHWNGFNRKAYESHAPKWHKDGIAQGLKQIKEASQ